MDDGSRNIAGSSLNATGAMAVLNIGNFITFTTEVQGQNFMLAHISIYSYDVLYMDIYG